LKHFLDTSVFIAAFWGAHVHHDASIKLLASAAKKDSACGAHSLAEVFAVMTTLPVKPAIPPEQAMLFIEETRRRLTLVSLDGDEYCEMLRGAAEAEITGARIYDVLLLRCAEKSRAQTIYTWNLRHFQLLAPQLKDRLRTP
jgi:predicted nucleic acid-binding protein